MKTIITTAREVISRTKVNYVNFQTTNETTRARRSFHKFCNNPYADPIRSNTEMFLIALHTKEIVEGELNLKSTLRRGETPFTAVVSQIKENISRVQDRLRTPKKIAA